VFYSVRTVLAQCTVVGGRPSFAQPSGLLHLIASNVSEILVVVDMLDGTEDTEWWRLISDLRRLVTLLPAFRLILTFCPHPYVIEDFADAVVLEIHSAASDFETKLGRRLSEDVDERNILAFDDT
jgi:hypothetical protein